MSTYTGNSYLTHHGLWSVYRENLHVTFFLSHLLQEQHAEGQRALPVS